MNLSSSVPDYIKAILDLVNSAGFEAFVVGGAVRDLVTGRVPHDFDIASSASPNELMKILKSRDIPYVDMAKKHGTITAITSGGNVEITTFRSDGDYLDARHPSDVTFTRNIDEDVIRRDFTMNSLYLSSDGEICDLTGGLEDIEEHKIKAVGDPELRFDEDALRILRGIRFEAMLGFYIEDKTRLAMDSKADKLKLISAERVQTEFIHLLRCPFASKAIRDNLDILSLIIPELKEMAGFDQKSRYHDLDMLEHTLKVLDGIPLEEGGLRDGELAVAALLHDTGKPASFVLDKNGLGHMKGHPRISREITSRVLTSLKCSKAFISDVEGLVELHDTFVPLTFPDVHRFMSEHSGEFLARLAVLQRADINAHSEYGLRRMAKLDGRIDIEQELRAQGAAFKITDLKIRGEDLIRLGCMPGPCIGSVLGKIFEMHINGDVPNERGALLALARDLL